MNNVNRTDVLRLEGICKYFPLGGLLSLRPNSKVRAVERVSLSIPEGTTLGLVGESGCGKTTLGRIIVGLVEPTEGNVYFKGENLALLRADERHARLRKIQMIFQDLYSSLNPSFTVGENLWEGYRHRPEARGLKRIARREQLKALAQMVGLPSSALDAFPHQLSGGQRQRVNIARAMSVNPQCIVADEPTSALDVSVQAQILNLFIELQEAFDLTYLLISHNLSVVRYICDRVAVMYFGVIVEVADAVTIFSQPLHPYTQALLAAVPNLLAGVSIERPLVEGDLPSPSNPPRGCRFHPRCSFVMDRCREIEPALTTGPTGHQIACYLHGCREVPSNPARATVDNP